MYLLILNDALVNFVISLIKCLVFYAKILEYI